MKHVLRATHTSPLTELSKRHAAHNLAQHTAPRATRSTTHAAQNTACSTGPAHNTGHKTLNT
eukprot:8757665-Alexandrium_andersonii.AAC.1